jgi:hypothetical protein
MRSVDRWKCVVVGLVGLSCSGSTEPAPAHVRFQLDSPTCGGPLTFQLYVDAVHVGAETLLGGAASATRPVTPGTHTFRGAIEPGAFVHDTTMTLGASETGTVVLAPYCS